MSLCRLPPDPRAQREPPDVRPRRPPRQPPRPRDQPLPAPARPQPRRLVPLGRAKPCERARDEDQPIFLSIGYSACHWCHVMERESFENDAIAALMNEHFVNIKVDREERPDLDADLHDRRPGHDRPRRLAHVRLPHPRPASPSTAAPTSPPKTAAACPASPASSHAVADAWHIPPRRHSTQGAAEMVAHLEDPRPGPPPTPSGPRPRPPRPGRRPGLGQSLRTPPRRLRRRPQVPPPHGPPPPAAPARPRPAAGEALAHGPPHPRQDGPRRHLRPPRRRLRPLLHRRPLARPPLRKNALRQRPARTTYLEAYQVTHDPDYARVARETLDYVLPA